MITETLGVVGLGLITAKLVWRPSKYPPGPRGLPFVGYAPFFTRLDPEYPYIAMTKLAETYGPVVGTWMGTQATILVTGPEAAKECFLNEDLNGRPDHVMFIDRSEDKKSRRGLMFWDGPGWSEQRRFHLRELRDLGWGRITTEGVVQEEIRDLIGCMEREAAKNDGLTDMQRQFTVSVINILWTIIAGQRHARNDTNFLDFLNKIELMFRAGTRALQWMIPFPFLRHIIPNCIGWTTLQDSIGSMRSFFKKAIDEHRRTMTEEPRDFIDIYLKRMIEEEEKGTAEQNGFSEDQLIVSIIDIFGAGAESTSNSIAFALIHMIRNPDVQKKVQEEIDQVVGKERIPSISDRPRLPFVEAVLAEVYRVSNIAMIAVPRRAMKDTTLMGYHIPKNALVQISIWSIHMDKKYWGDPENFRPERHLDENGKLKKTGVHLVPFSLGKRSCPGEALARSNVFLFFTALMQKFEYSIPPGHARPTIRPNPGFTAAPKPFFAVIKPR